MHDKYIDNIQCLRVRKAKDIQKTKHGHDWRTSNNDTIIELNKKCREPQELLFEVGLVYICTFNDNKKSNSQKAILYELLAQETLDRFERIKVLLAPPGCKEVIYNENKPKEYYFDKPFKETSIGLVQIR